MCIFSAHSVIRDPPFSRLDLISCRNLMIYLKPGLQAQIIPLFHYALRPSGYLFLGSSENVSRHSELYTSLDRKSRIFRRRDLATRPPLALQQFLPQTRREAAGPEENNSGLLKRSDSLRRAANTIVEHFAPTFVIVDEIGQTLDVTNLVAAEEQQKVPAAELSHRVKNTLAVVSSIAERTLTDDETKENLIGRLHALGHTHDVLSESGWTEAGLRELISAELSPHGTGDGSVLQISGPPVMLRPQAALFLTLALHELSTNAAKYGALSIPGGRVAVSWIITGDRPPRLEINWQEEGGPKVDGLGASGFGTELIERGIRFELQGEAKLETVNGGLHCRIVIPASPQNLTFGVPGRRARVEDRS